MPYRAAWDLQREIAQRVRGGGDPVLILLEHPPVYTLGVRGNERHVLATAEALSARGADVIRSDRGGDVTFHGPGQIVGYPILRVRDVGMGAVAYVRALEQTMIDALAGLGVAAGRRQGAPGVWTDGKKIGAIGVRITGGVTQHGFALNASTDLAWFQHIIPCGIADAGVTSIAAVTGTNIAQALVEDALTEAFGRNFGVEMIDAEALVGR
jgi:lipoyl(octanoyl) transferase